VSLVSTAAAVVVRDIDISLATVATLASLVAGGSEGSRISRHTHVAVVLPIVCSTNNLTGAVRDGASGESVGSHFFLLSV
jgi:hypothetical protein